MVFQGSLIWNSKIIKLKTIYWPKHHPLGCFLPTCTQSTSCVTDVEYEKSPGAMGRVNLDLKILQTLQKPVGKNIFKQCKEQRLYWLILWLAARPALRGSAAEIYHRCCCCCCSRLQSGMLFFFQHFRVLLVCLCYVQPLNVLTWNSASSFHALLSCMVLSFDSILLFCGEEK